MNKKFSDLKLKQKNPVDMAEFKRKKAFWSQQAMFDMGVLVQSDCFYGKYNGNKLHSSDFEQVISKACSFGVKYFLFPSSYIDDLHLSLYQCRKVKNSFTTVGLHPTKVTEPLVKAKIEP
jgi:Tat protein secretion system quality control protein TatD with DNase activity